MTEEQFWKSNPRIINIWFEAWKKKQNRENELQYMYTGNYELSALITAIDKVLNGKKAKAKYIEKPVQLFELTEEEKKAEQQKAINQFMVWANSTQKKYSKKEGG
jgi:hypothetical protein